MNEMQGSAALYDSWSARIATDADLIADKLQILLVGIGYTPDLKTHSTLDDVKDELSGAGYSRQAIKNMRSEATPTGAAFYFDDVTFSARRGRWSVHRWVMFDNSLKDRPLIACGSITGDGVDVQIADGQDLTLKLGSNAFLEIVKK